MMNLPLEVDRTTLQDWLESGRTVDILDIRPRADFEAWSLPESLHLDAYDAIYANSPGPLAHYVPEDDRPVVAVCFVGQTSKIAAKYLRSRGIRAASLTGGMQAWSLASNTANVPLQTSEASVIQVRRTGKGCLSYLVARDGEAVIIDPSVELVTYVELAREKRWRIRMVIDTHIHADHLSRAKLLAEKARAPYCLPRQDRVSFDHEVLDAGDVITIGDATLTALHTPGHTWESMCLLLDGEALFSADTLFLNGVGRPDLAADRDKTAERARALHRSLLGLESLPGETIVLPCHTDRPVPFDRIPLMSSLESVIGRIDAFRMGEAEFVSWIRERTAPTPSNYTTIIEHNERGTLPALDPTLLEVGGNQCLI